MKKIKRSSNSLRECGLTAKQCKGIGMQVAGQVLEKCLRCPVYKGKRN